MKKVIYLTFTLAFLVSCLGFNKQSSQQLSGDTNEYPIEKRIEKTNAEWKKELSTFVYHVTREAGTERSFSGEFWDNKEKGTYTCSNCELPLFSSETKFKSGTGWPSYYDDIEDSHVYEKADNSHGWNRVEVLCGRCDAHLGHVFEDGPKPTGLRYCINSASLLFEPISDKE